MARLLSRVWLKNILRCISSSSNQKHAIASGILILCLILLINNYVATMNKTNYFALLTSQLDHLTYDVHLKPVRVCCLVVTMPQNLLTRTRVVNVTWGSRCDRLFFITEIPEKMTLEQEQFLKQVPIAPIHNLTSGRNYLPMKSRLAFLFAYTNYLNDCDWFVKADDDTYLIVENLKKFLRKQNTTDPVTFGYNFKVIVKDGYHSGGASYVLSREALRRFYEGHLNPDNTACRKDTGAEDAEISICLRKQGVRLGNSLDEHNRELFHPLPFHDHFRGSVPDWLIKNSQNAVQSHYNCCSDQSISFHYVSPEDQYYLDFLLYKVRL